MNNSRVLNSYKVLFLLMSYQAAMAIHAAGYKLNLNSAITRRPAVDKLIRANHFSDIDSIALETLFDLFEGIFGENDISLEEIIDFYITIADKIPNNDKALLKRLGVNQPNYDHIGGEMKKLFVNERFFTNMKKQLKADLTFEMNAREKNITRLGVTQGKSVDDTLLVAFNKKLSSCESFDDVEDLLLTYTTANGGDLINGFLRGDMSALKSKKPKIKGSWGKSLNVSFDLLLESAIRALQAKGKTVYGKLPQNIILYRGLGIDGLLKFINVDKNSIIKKCKRWGDFECLLCDYINKQKPIYKTNAITSTSLDEKVAYSNTERNCGDDKGAVFMRISVGNNSTFGKNFKDTTFASDDYNQEVILKPNQRIKLKSAICAEFDGDDDSFKKFIKGNISSIEKIDPEDYDEMDSESDFEYNEEAILLIDCETI